MSTVNTIVVGEGASMGVVERVYARTVKSDGCWEWQGCRSKRKYGTISVGGAMVYVHRITLEEAVGPAPEGRPHALHHCDNELCVRPDHLYWGTQEQNVMDSIRRNRRHGLTDAQWREVDDLLRAGRSQRSLAREYGVSQAAISKHVRKAAA